ncbi:hypothetical protein F2Q70_00030621 [Brassica cretica]|uniref:Uncharacterized protein n=1 Tax=Brassica cretica TaxID=69181 RepID=A0A8S9FP64_BRACR|nr:hypothetical protein F2Q70_00030621 [Brassica cretica]
MHRGLSLHYQVKVSEVDHGMAPPSHLLDSEIPQKPKSETGWIYIETGLRGDGETPVSSRRGDRETMMSVADGTIEVNFSYDISAIEKVRPTITGPCKIQTQRAAKATRPASIDRCLPASVDNNSPHSNPVKSQPDSYTRAEIDQLIEEIYRTLESTEVRLDRRCDDIYFPMDLTMSSLTS